MSRLDKKASPFGSDSTPNRLPQRVVIALTRRERTLFLNDNAAASLQTAVVCVADDGDLVSAGWQQRLEKWRPNVLVTGWTTPPIPETWTETPECPLKYVCHVTGSVRQLVPRSFIARGGLVTNWGDQVSDQVAEHGLLLALAALRNNPAWRPFISRPPQTRRLEEIKTQTLFNRRIGLHGFGSIARALIRLLKPFGGTISAYSNGVPVELMQSCGVNPCASLKELFAKSEIVFECESLTEASAGSVNDEVLAALPDDGVFVNIARGSLVDDAALQREGASGRLRLALDVAAGEPLTLRSPYARMPAVVLSPHIAGPTLDRYRFCGSLAWDHLSTYLAGKLPLTVTLEMYDRAT